ncbi:hypothetical protein [Bauldia sp.]|uniref:hypothetical protein n=1 Tax=Bauldia sp. TaxID=2575872 RepID=UPI003BA983C2
MTDDKDKSESTPSADEDAVQKEERADVEERKEAIDEFVSIDMPPAAAGEIIDVDKRLNEESETEKNLEDGN